MDAGGQLDPGDWKKLSALHCQATQSVLTFLCSLEGWSRMVKFASGEMVSVLREDQVFTSQKLKKK
jgi:hypothetical protein